MESQNYIDKYFPVLDNGFVALKEYMGGDEAIEEAARVSYGKGTRKKSETRTLLRYLMRHKHTTPTEMCVLKFHISMPIHVHRQFIRHRMSTTNEYSARYSVVPEVTYDNYELGEQSKNNKQGRTDIGVGTLYSDMFNSKKDELKTKSFELYNDMLREGVAREVARMHLPLNTYTYFYWKIDLHNLFHFLKLRCDSHAQWEIRQYANTIAGLAKIVAPLSFEAWYDYIYQGVTFTRLDRELLDYIHKLEYLQLYQPADVLGELSLGGIGNKAVLEHAESLGMSKREIDEFVQKLKVPKLQNFDLHLENAKDASFFNSEKE